MKKFVGPVFRIFALMAGFWLGSTNCSERHGALCEQIKGVLPGVIIELEGVF